MKLKVSVAAIPFGYRICFVYGRYLIFATTFRVNRQTRRGRKKQVGWTFTTSNFQTPTAVQEHELPIFAAFLLECHQRLSASIRDNKFTPKALENK